MTILLRGCIKFRKNKNSEKTSVRARNTPFGSWREALTCSLTICTQDRECLFGDIVDGGMRLNDAGRIVAEEWRRTATIRDSVRLDEWVIMPNHFHGILIIVGDGWRGDPPVALANSVN